MRVPQRGLSPSPLTAYPLPGPLLLGGQETRLKSLPSSWPGASLHPEPLSSSFEDGPAEPASGVVLRRTRGEGCRGLVHSRGSTVIVQWMNEKKFIWTDSAYRHPGDDIMARCGPEGTPAVNHPAPIPGPRWLALRGKSPPWAQLPVPGIPIRNRSVTRHFSKPRAGR